MKSSGSVEELKPEPLWQTILCCPFRCAVSLFVGAILCACCIPLCICNMCAISVIMCCCNPSLATLEQIYRRPLWVFALEQEKMLTQVVYEICLAVFSHTNFDQQALSLFDEIEKSGDGVVDDSELEAFLKSMPSSVALTDADRQSMMGLYNRITGRKTKISKEDFPIFLRCIFALVIAHGVVNLKLGKTDINLAGFGAGGPDVETGPSSLSEDQQASIHEIPSDEEDNKPDDGPTDIEAMKPNADAVDAQPAADIVEKVELNVQ